MAITERKALVQQHGELRLVSLPIPIPGEHQLLVKVSHVAQNPTDVQSFDKNAFGDGAVLGCDFVGTVESIGQAVNRFKPGDVIAGLIWGGEIKGLGGYSEFTLADEAICFPVPDSLSSEQAATVPLASCTALLALFSKNCLGSVIAHCVIPWGGSSSVGQYAIQIASLHGLRFVTTCSPRNHGLAKSLGASNVFDYRDDDVVGKIKENDTDITYVSDTIGSETSSILSSEAISDRGGELCTVRPGKQHTEGVTKRTRTAFLKEHRYGDFYWPADPGDHELASSFFARLSSLLADGKIKPNATKVFEGGLGDISSGFTEYCEGKVSNYKIVYKL
ncbi:unnamed protein product [Clonostachys rosea]|uniref:Enoyl reductase (ER) domain-containing protein n=1 Tax=Bionectria ochroleuca TaxID=29856 RepID=A0ABY6UY27_BIOOC|nr:unnamed protein product [Clonostachys rosea]